MEFNEQATAIFSKHLEQWESDPLRMESGYHYEMTYATMMKNVEKEILQLSVGKVPKSKNSKKKLQTRFGKIELCKKHLLSQSPTTMNISSYAQETMCYVGQYLVFEEAEDLINSFTGADVNAKQIERVCHLYGQAILEEDLHNIEVNQYEEVSACQEDKTHYVSVDGSMYLTREDSWKEIKLGRIFEQQDIIRTSKSRTVLTNSRYVAHLGSSKDFLPKMEYYIEGLKNKVFIADGATWIWNWIEDTYPDSVQIVDFYHAKEHLCEFANMYFEEKHRVKQWIDQQSDTMFNKGITPVIKALEALEITKNTSKQREKLLNYYRKNENRMQYHTFRQKGLLIGSGAIESAHKDVLQQRLKLSGQRWTMDGLQQMAQLRVVYKSGETSRIREIIQKAA